MRKSCITGIVGLLCTASISAQTFSLVKDINPGPGHASPVNLVAIGNELFFSANDGTHGQELWISDGSEAGTQLIKDINPGAAHGLPSGFLKVSGVIYFKANDGAHGDELWRTDGTEAGTILVKDINPGTAGSSISSLVNLNNRLYFTANDGQHGQELWQTDGTDAGTMLVKDINISPAGGYPGNNAYPSSLVVMSNKLYFKAMDAPNQPGLWKSDGTEAGTTLVKYVTIGEIKKIGNTLFFSGGGDPAPTLWKSDGTANGTIQIKTTGPISALTEVNGVAFFYTIAGSNINIWKSDGTANGTVQTKLIPAAGVFSVGYFTNVDGTLFFVAPHPAGGTELWKSDGTGDGTMMVRDINPGAAGSDPYQLINANGKLFFRATNGVLGKEIWKSDGTEAGTYMVQDIARPGDALPSDFTLVGGKLFVSVIDNIHGRELWMSDVSPPLTGGLPLTIVALKGRLSGGDVLLDWKTVAEHNTSHFEIERSSDGRSFGRIGTKNAAGNSATEIEYLFKDENAATLNLPVLFYRLKMKDLDEKFVYSKTVAVLITSPGGEARIFPNPVGNHDAVLVLGSPLSEKLTYSIVDQQGRVVQKKSVLLTQGNNSLLLETASLPAGIYIITYRQGGIKSSMRLIKQ